MTPRAVMLGLLAALFIATVGYWNEEVLRSTPFVPNHFPIIVFGTLIVVVIAVNPLLGWLRKGWSFRSAEFAVIAALMTAACSIPGRGLLNYLTPCLMVPHRYQLTEAGWRRHDIIDYVPGHLMVSRDVAGTPALAGFIEGLDRPPGQRHIGLGDVPWGVWVQPLSVWVAIIVLLSVCVICLSLIVHRQWSAHERLQYPIAKVAGAIFAEGDQAGAGSLRRNGLFWLGLGAVLFIRTVNGLNAWFPDSITVPLSGSLEVISQKFPYIGQVPGTWGLLQISIFPTVIAFGYLLASDVGLSVACSYPLWMVFNCIVYKPGLLPRSDWLRGGGGTHQVFGSFIGATLMMLYAGRRYYTDVLRRALWLPIRGRVADYAVWALRILPFAAGGVIALLTAQGLQWPFAVIAVFVLLLTYVVIARISAEAGLFFIEVGARPMVVAIGLFGMQAIGPQPIAVLTLMGLVLSDTGGCLMPFIVNGLKLSEQSKVSVGRVGGWAASTFIIALLAALPAVLWLQYNFGLRPGWGNTDVPQFVFTVAVEDANLLSGKGMLDEVNRLTVWERIRRMDPGKDMLWGVPVGIALYVGFSALRLRLPWWPLHPVIFLVGAMYPLKHFWWSFLIGWAVKQAFTRLGGGGAYRRGTALMIGVIAGDLIGGLIFMLVAALYYLATGSEPVAYRIFP